MSMYEALAIVCRHCGIHNTLALILEKKALDYLRPQTCLLELETKETVAELRQVRIGQWQTLSRKLKISSSLQRWVQDLKGFPTLEELVMRDRLKSAEYWYPENWQNRMAFLCGKHGKLEQLLQHLTQGQMDLKTFCRCDRWSNEWFHLVGGTVFGGQADIISNLEFGMRSPKNMEDQANLDIAWFRDQVKHLACPPEPRSEWHVCQFVAYFDHVGLLDHVGETSKSQVLYFCCYWNAVSVCKQLLKYATQEHLFNAIYYHAFECALELLPIGFAPGAMARIYRGYDQASSCFPKQDKAVAWMLDHGCALPEVADFKPTMAAKDGCFSRVVHLVSCSGRQLPSAWIAEIDARVNGNFVDGLTLLEACPKLAKPDLLLRAAKFNFSVFQRAIALVPLQKADGRLWYTAALHQQFETLHYLAQQQHTWKTVKKLNWSLCCDSYDWRLLHAWGSPCRLKH